MGELLLGCSGWNYPDTADKGGWPGVFYPDKDTKRLRYQSQFFNTAEMDSTFYEKYYLYSEQELKPWVEKVDQIKKHTKILHVYSNNHYGGKAVVNALQFKAMTGHSLSELETNALKHGEICLFTV